MHKKSPMGGCITSCVVGVDSMTITTEFQLPSRSSRRMTFVMTVYPDKIQVGAGAELIQTLLQQLQEHELDILIRWGNPEFSTGFLAGKFVTPEGYSMMAVSSAAGALTRREVVVRSK